VAGITFCSIPTKKIAMTPHETNSSTSGRDERDSYCVRHPGVPRSGWGQMGRIAALGLVENSFRFDNA
jgi:hypothetical protein